MTAYQSFQNNSTFLSLNIAGKCFGRKIIIMSDFILFTSLYPVTAKGNLSPCSLSLTALPQNECHWGIPQPENAEVGWFLSVLQK